MHHELAFRINGLLERVDAAQLRGLILSILPLLDEAALHHLLLELAQQAFAAPGAAPAPAPEDAPDDALLEEIEDFLSAARRVRYADPDEVDNYLKEGTRAFRARDYAAAAAIFKAIMLPIAACDFELGYDEHLNDSLGVDVEDCVQQYLVALYMTSPPEERASVVLAAIHEVDMLYQVYEPLKEIEAVILEPLPDLEGFLARWRALLEERAAARARPEPNGWEARWLREAVARTTGPDGMAQIARQSRREDDLRAWCGALREARDWPAARAAYEEAATLTGDRYLRGELLDGAALAAQEGGMGDLDAALERAWRGAPSLPRLCRWLGACETREALLARAAAALEAPALVPRQRGLLYLLRGALAEAAALLADAPGDHWTDPEHPGLPLFALLVGLIGGGEDAARSLRAFEMWRLLKLNDHEGLREVSLDALLQLAQVAPAQDAATRAAVIGALQAASRAHMAAVSARMSRHEYEFSVAMAVSCARADGSPAGAAWLRALKEEFRRYPALQRAFKQARA